LKIKKMTLKILLSLCLVSIITSCGNEGYSYELMTLEKVKNNILDQEVSISIIDIPNEIISTEAENQAGYEIGDSGDRIFIYEYKNNKTMQKDSNKIHNNLNEISLPNTPLIMTAHNVFIIYIKKEKEDYEIENKILQVL